MVFGDPLQMLLCSFTDNQKLFVWVGETGAPGNGTEDVRDGGGIEGNFRRWHFRVLSSLSLSVHLKYLYFHLVSYSVSQTNCEALFSQTLLKIDNTSTHYVILRLTKTKTWSLVHHNIWYHFDRFILWLIFTSQFVAHKTPKQKSAHDSFIFYWHTAISSRCFTSHFFLYTAFHECREKRSLLLRWLKKMKQ